MNDDDIDQTGNAKYLLDLVLAEAMMSNSVFGSMPSVA